MNDKAPIKIEIWYNLLTGKPVNSVPSNSTPEIKGKTRELELFCHGLDVVNAFEATYALRPNSLRGYIDRGQQMAHAVYDQQHN